MRIALCFLIIIEILCHSFLKDRWGAAATSWIYLIIGLSIGLLPVLISTRKAIRAKHEPNLYSLRLPFILLMTLGVIHYVKDIFTSTDIDYKVADMLPVIDTMSLRYIQGKPVYDIIPEIWGGMQPIYLPAMWLPYSISHILDIDMRWLSVFAMLISCSLIITTLKRTKSTPIHLIIVGIPLLLNWNMLLVYDHSMISITQEGIVIGYYLLLSYALISQRWWLVGISIGLCLMSRYALAPWVLGLGIYLLISKNYKAFREVTIVSVFTTLVLIISTGTIPHLNMIFGMPQNYLTSVQLDPGKYLPTIESNLGLTKFIAFENLGWLHSGQLCTSIVLPLVLFALYRYGKIKMHFNLYALCVLKLTLVVFYNLLIIPYSYLFYTSTFTSIAVLTGYIVVSYQDNGLRKGLVTD